MGATTIAGLVIAAIGILGGFTIEGGSVGSLINIPGFMIVVVGTLGATVVSFPPAMLKAIPTGYMRALKGGDNAEPQEMAKGAGTC